VSTGAENDLKAATDIATNMVAHYGMSDRLGPVYHEHKIEHPFLGQRIATEGGTSDATVHAIEDETRRMIGDALKVATDLLTVNRAALDRLAAALLERETLERAELDAVLGAGATPGNPRLVDVAAAAAAAAVPVPLFRRLQ
jgi:cell division protease FtsH